MSLCKKCPRRGEERDKGKAADQVGRRKGLQGWRKGGQNCNLEEEQPSSISHHKPFCILFRGRSNLSLLKCLPHPLQILKVVQVNLQTRKGDSVGRALISFFGTSKAPSWVSTADVHPLYQSLELLALGMESSSDSSGIKAALSELKTTLSSKNQVQGYPHRHPLFQPFSASPLSSSPLPLLSSPRPSPLSFCRRLACLTPQPSSPHLLSSIQNSSGTSRQSPAPPARARSGSAGPPRPREGRPRPREVQTCSPRKSS